MAVVNAGTILALIAGEVGRVEQLFGDKQTPVLGG
jgi:hypothetical protein